MADNVVTVAELVVMANYFVTAEYPYFEELREAFKLLRVTGCRIQEIFEINRWYHVEGNNYKFIPQKKNSFRYVILDDNFTAFKAAIAGQYSPFLGRTYSQLQGIFNKINPWGKLYSGEKEITNYFFRYLYVRELQADGLTLTQISEHMGYSSTTAVNNYLDAELLSTEPVPVPVDNIISFGGVEYPFVILGNLKVTTLSLRYFKTGMLAKSLYNDTANDLLFGKYYHINDFSLIAADLPAGWRITTKADFSSIFSIYSPLINVAERFKSTDPLFWLTPSSNSNESNLSLKGNGTYMDATLYSFKTFGYYWTTTKPSATTTYMLYVRDNASTFSYASRKDSKQFFAPLLICSNV